MADEQWSKEAPKADGAYWWRADESDNDPDIHLVQGEFFYQVGFGSSEFVKNFGGEWLGPITPADAEQLVSLRTAAQAALEWIDVQAETWTCQHADQPMRCSRCSLRAKAKELSDQLRAALNPQQQKGAREQQ